MLMEMKYMKVTSFNLPHQTNQPMLSYMTINLVVIWQNNFITNMVLIAIFTKIG